MPSPPCPICGASGRGVPALTVKSLALPSVASRVTQGPYFFCETRSCPVVYHEGAGELLVKDQIAVRVGCKELQAPRLVCYCFGHTAEEIQQDAATEDGPRVIAEIEAKIRSGLCACETTNPEGVCCLGRAREVARCSSTKPGRTMVVDSSPGSDADFGEAGCCQHPAGDAERSDR